MFNLLFDSCLDLNGFTVIKSFTVESNSVSITVSYLGIDLGEDE